mgnify:CR=1 FL=1
MGWFDADVVKFNVSNKMKYKIPQMGWNQIRIKKDSYCDSLVTMEGTLTASEENAKGLTITYEAKKCSFVKTEKNYRIIRNLELQTGVELIQSSAEIKTDVTEVIAKNGKLVDALKAVCAAAKDAKTKFRELRDAASHLDGCRKDSCNSSQMAASASSRLTPSEGRPSMRNKPGSTVPVM